MALPHFLVFMSARSRVGAPPPRPSGIMGSLAPLLSVVLYPSPVSFYLLPK